MTAILVLGLGEVGQPLLELIEKAAGGAPWFWLDAKLGAGSVYGKISSDPCKPDYLLDLVSRQNLKGPLFMHVCFPEQPQFVQKVIDYIMIYKPQHVIIHSTTTPGVCVKIQELVEPKMPGTLIYSSPVRGNIRDGMKACLLGYWKYLAPARWDTVTNSHTDYIGEDRAKIKEAVAHLKRLGMHVREHPCATDLEWAKTLDLGFYGVVLAYYQFLERMVENRGVDYEIVREFIESTPEQSQGKAQRIVFYGGYIGGHCVVPALERLAVMEKSLLVAPAESLVRAALESNDTRLIELVDHKPKHHP